MIAIFCPTRSKPNFAADLALSYTKRPHEHSELILVIPQDQDSLYPVIPGTLRRLHPFTGITGVVKPSNWASAQLLDYDHLALINDDMLFRTEDWEARVLRSLETHWLCYTNDLHQGPNLCGLFFVRSDVVRALGWFHPPMMKHLCVDCVWTDFCREVGGTEYLPDVVIEHIHPHAGKRPMDEITGSLNAGPEYTEAHRVWNVYKQQQLAQDVAKIRKVVCTAA